MDLTLAIVLIIVCALVGIIVGFLVCMFLPVMKAKRAQTNANKIINDAENKADRIKKNAQIDAKQDIFEMKKEAEKDIKERKEEVVVSENKLNQREQTIDARDAALLKKEQSLEDKDKNLDFSIQENKKRGALLQEKIDSIIVELQKVANMSEKEARDQIFAKVEEKEQINIAKFLREKEDEAETTANDKARDILANALARQAQEVTTERTVNVISLPSDEMKGRIIGREGRNIKSLEQLLGVDILIDDTPEAITVSCFNPIRREIASRTLSILIKDGRIQPGRIEEVIAKCQKELDESIRKAGEDALLKLGISGMNKELVTYVGRLKFRTSYGQNQLDHSVETAFICGTMAAELGLDQQMAKRAGLLHDIGKSCDYEVEGSHVEIGARLARKYGESDIVVNSIAAHHNDVPCKSVIAYLVQSADTLSAARPGARSETLETYIKRIEQLETICKGFDGVQTCYAMQSGREVRVIVLPEKIDDLGAFNLARQIREKIESDMKYPGQIKVNVIREYRAIETAK
ncbi:MAG: ribonuclease Y [Erysipelotrichaceae bacterium]|nr:ribonuclease Y [Erysipelotrichaceae bacterium]MCB9499959.1 ribonuclease Y [Erysipelotrichaceae bacterium]